MTTHDRFQLARSPSTFLAGVLLVLAGCASTSPDGEFRLVEHPERPLESHGFVFYPPSVGTWAMAKKVEEDRAQYIFMLDLGAPRQSDKIGPTTYISVTVDRTPLETFSKLFPNQHAALEKLAQNASEPTSGRFKDLSCETTWGDVKGQEFSRVVRRGEERDNPIDRHAVLTVDSRSTSFFHPTQPATVMCVVISHRSPQGQKVPPLADLEDRFLSKIAFQ